MVITGLIRRWRARRQRRIAEQYGYLSAEERAALRELREEHDPLGEITPT